MSQHGKGWRARQAKTATSAEHPGTAVFWDGECFEVMAAERGAAGGVRYLLRGWTDEHAIRVTDSYDPAREAAREEERRKAEARESGRVAANLLGLLTGHLPAVVQERLGSDTGIVPTRLTFLSLILPLAFQIWVAVRGVGRILDPTQPGVPRWMVPAAVYLIAENIIRLLVVLSQNRPIGSAAGVCAYVVYWAAAGRWSGAVSPFAVGKGSAVVITTPEDDVALRDAFAMREPLLTLLAPGEQQILQQRFGFDYRRSARGVAFVIFLFCAAGVVTSLVTLQKAPSLTAFSSLVLAGGLAVEQAYRLVALGRGPAGSVLAVLVRPFARALFG